MLQGMIERIIGSASEYNSSENFLDNLMEYVCSNIDVETSHENFIIKPYEDKKMGYIRIFIQNCKSKNGELETAMQKESKEFLKSKKFRIKELENKHAFIFKDNSKEYLIKFIKFENHSHYLIDIGKAEQI